MKKGTVLGHASEEHSYRNFISIKNFKFLHFSPLINSRILWAVPNEDLLGVLCCSVYISTEGHPLDYIINYMLLKLYNTLRCTDVR